MPDPKVIEFECPRCLGNVRALSEQAGQRIDCPNCQGALLVPSQSNSQDLFEDIFESNNSVSENPSAEADPLIAGPDDPLPPQDAAKPPAEPLASEADQPLHEEDLLSGIETQSAETASSDANPLDGKDPFEVDPDAPIKVDGIGDLYSHDDVYGIKCNVCDTRIHVRPDQINSHVECPECFSKILVTPPNTEKPAQRWVKEGRGNFQSSETETDDELRLSEPVERPKIEKISEAHGLDPVTDDLLAPKSNSEERDTSGPEESEDPPLLEIIDDDSGSLELEALDDDDSEIPSLELVEENPDPELSLEPEPKSAPIPNVASKKPAARRPEKTRRELLEESQKRQQAAEAGPAFKRNDAEAEQKQEQKNFPEFDFVSLLNAVKDMLQSPGIILRAAMAIALMSLGTILMQWIWPSHVPNPEPGKEAETLTFVQSLVLGFQWTVIGVVPYMIGLATLWFTCAYIFRDAALGNRQVLSWKNSGTAELKATFLLFSFAFFIGGLPMPPLKPFVFLILPMRFLLGTLFLVSAWYSQSAFSIVNIDAFKNAKHHMSRWTQYYIFILALAAGGFFAGMMFWMRDLIPSLAVNALISMIAVTLMSVVSLAFAAACGWHCGQVVEELEESENAA